MTGTVAKRWLIEGSQSYKRSCLRRIPPTEASCEVSGCLVSQYDKLDEHVNLDLLQPAKRIGTAVRILVKSALTAQEAA